MKDWTKEDFLDFMQILLSRLEMGRQVYGMASLHKTQEELIEEVNQEVLDICGWSFIRWYQLRQELKKLQDAKVPTNPSCCRCS